MTMEIGGTKKRHLFINLIILVSPNKGQQTICSFGPIFSEPVEIFIDANHQ